MSDIKLSKNLLMTKNGCGWLMNMKLTELFANGTCMRACAEANYFEDVVCNNICKALTNNLN